MNRSGLLGSATLSLFAQLVAAQAPLPLKHAPQPTTAAITAADLMTRLYIFADDSMMGRQAGTEYNLKGTAYIESEVRKLGLKPAGDNGGYFQDVPLVQRTLADNVSLSAEGTTFARPTDFLVFDGGTSSAIDGVQTIFAGTFPDTAHMISAAQANGKVLILNVSPGAPQSALMRYAGAAAIFIPILDMLPPQAIQFLSSPGRVTMKSDQAPGPTRVFISRKTAAALLGTPIDQAAPGTVGQTVHGSIAFVEKPAPGRNVVAILPGSDPKVRDEYVAIGAHNDHIGFTHTPLDHDSLRAYNTVIRPQGADSPNRTPSADEWTRIRAMTDSLHVLHGGARLDSISNGADDDGSGSVAVLEIAEAFAKERAKPRRSILFVWHTGEELGLFGSTYFTDHPTVPRESIVAQLNIDMIGRGGPQDMANGGPGYLTLIGSRRLSTELGDLVETVNKDTKAGFTFDYQFDANGHPEQFYCRSDHYEYARYGIPIVFFSTGGHRDYHQLTDEPQYIDYDHFARVTQLVHDIAARVANLDHRVLVDKPKPDPHGRCVQ
jgi:hypothetical protein